MFWGLGRIDCLGHFAPQTKGLASLSTVDKAYWYKVTDVCPPSFGLVADKAPSASWIIAEHWDEGDGQVGPNGTPTKVTSHEQAQPCKAKLRG